MSQSTGRSIRDQRCKELTPLLDGFSTLEAFLGPKAHHWPYIVILTASFQYSYGLWLVRYTVYRRATKGLTPNYCKVPNKKHNLFANIWILRGQPN